MAASQKVYLDERGDDSKDGMSRETAVLSARRAIAIAIREQTEEFFVSGSQKYIDRINARLADKKD